MKTINCFLLLVASATGLAQTFQYDAAGRMTGVNYSNGRSLRYSYDAADNLTAVEAASQEPSSRSLPASPGGVQTVTTAALAEQTTGGYAILDAAGGQAPYAAAIFSLVQNGAVVFEAAVPASPPTTRALVFVDRRNNVRSASGQFQDAVSVDTGVAVVNPGATRATVRYTLRGPDGSALTSGEGALAAGRHFASLIGDLSGIAGGFQVPASFPDAINFGSLELESDRPISVTALRLTINQRGELLFTSTPVAGLAAESATGPLLFPHLANGGGFTSAFQLLNTTGLPESGSFRFYGDDGAPLSVDLTDGRSGSSFAYSMAPGGIAVIETTGAGPNVVGGWVQIIPEAGQPTPAGAGSFRFGQNGVVVTESGIAPATPTTLARVFVDTSGGHDTGLAIANPGAGPLTATVRAYGADGTTAEGDGSATLELPAAGHAANQAGSFVSGLPANFRGVLEVQSAQPFVALTVRSLVNSRGELLFATLPVADLRRPAPSLVIFPHIADGGGFRTELIVLGTRDSGASTVTFYGDDGAPAPVIEPLRNSAL